MEAEVALAVSPRSWSDRLHRFIADHGGVRVRTRVMTPEDALAESYEVLVIDDITSFLTKRLVAQVRSASRLVLGVYDPVEAPEGKQRLADLGVDDVIEADATPDEFLIAIRALASSRAVSGPVPKPLDVASPRRTGTVVVVTGASGGVGASEVAIAISLALASWSQTVLVDADDQGPSIAQRLALHLEPNLRAAIDILHHGSGDLAAALTRPRRTRLEVLAGLASRADWFELRPADVVEVIDRLASRRPFVVANVGHGIEDLPSFGGPMRTGVARAAIAAADQVVVVSSGSPVGLTRLLDWLAEARPLLDETPAHVVVNRTSGSLYRRAEIAREMEAASYPASISFTPEDRSLETAAWAGDLVAGRRFRGPIRRLARTIESGGLR